MKYLCLIYADRRYMMESLAAGDARQHFKEYEQFINDFRNRGQILGGNRLQLPETAATVRVRNGKLSTVDGPFAETKEQLAGFYMIEASDLNEAIQIAAKIPPARVGCIEVRPIRPIRETVAARLQQS
jgi:hypothetical protein